MLHRKVTMVDQFGDIQAGVEYQTQSDMPNVVHINGTRWGIDAWALDGWTVQTFGEWDL